LTHRNVYKGSFGDGLAISSADFFNVGSWINTREQDEEHGGLGVGFSIKLEDIEGLLLYVFDTKLF